MVNAEDFVGVYLREAFDRRLGVIDDNCCVAAMWSLAERLSYPLGAPIELALACMPASRTAARPWAVE
jgi:hypothetical protein